MNKAVLFLIFITTLTAFAQNHEQVIHNYFKATHAQQKKATQTKADILISEGAPLANSNATVYYVKQSYNEIPIENASATITLKANQVVDAHVNFLKTESFSNIKIAASKSATNIQDAVIKAMQLKGYRDFNFSSYENLSSYQYKFMVAANPDFPIYADLVYAKQSNSNFELTYNIELFDASLSKLHLLKIKADDLSMLSDEVLTLSCSHLNHNHYFSNSVLKNPELKIDNKTYQETNTSSSYLVYKSNLSGPLQGNRTIENNPYNQLASPFGWHDVDGISGADYFITRGNNVHAYADTNATNKPGYSPNGGVNLQFIYPFDGAFAKPESYVDAAITNLFYVTNKLHDIFYRFGFDENSGNFQENQYGRLSSNKYNTPDPLLAESQDGAGTNNANISVPRDGTSPRMQMYLWKPQNPENIFALTPPNLQGYFASADNVFQPGHVNLPALPDAITAKLVLVKTVDDNNLGCSTIINESELKNNIALIVRGTCGFAEKVYNAQKAGAIAVIIMNNVVNENLVSMAGEAPNVVIPALFVSKETGDLWLAEIENNQKIVLRLGVGDDTRIFDASFDNSIITHEFGHGVTIRLTGGRDNINCLKSAEQMGEGWSDYFALLFQIKSGDVGETPIGIGSYASAKVNAGEGIRQYPYSTDFSVNPLTYGATNTFIYAQDGITKVNEHKVGTVWASILWDLTWKLINQYGFDPEFKDPHSGNYIALNLVMNALKLQPCNPSFITGRNAILKADELLYSGNYSCLIWEAFANRGVGVNASAGFNSEVNDITDQIEDFTKPINCSVPQNFIPEIPKIKVYPNPIQNDLVISIPQYTSSLTIEIFDVHGRLVIKQNLDNFSIQARLKLNLLNKGIYFIRVNGKKVKYQSKIIKL